MDPGSSEATPVAVLSPNSNQEINPRSVLDFGLDLEETVAPFGCSELGQPFVAVGLEMAESEVEFEKLVVEPH